MQTIPRNILKAVELESFIFIIFPAIPVIIRVNIYNIYFCFLTKRTIKSLLKDRADCRQEKSKIRWEKEGERSLILTTQQKNIRYLWWKEIYNIYSSSTVVKTYYVFISLSMNNWYLWALKVSDEVKSLETSKLISWATGEFSERNWDKSNSLRHISLMFWLWTREQLLDLQLSHRNCQSYWSNI